MRLCKRHEITHRRYKLYAIPIYNRGCQRHNNQHRATTTTTLVTTTTEDRHERLTLTSQVSLSSSSAAAAPPRPQKRSSDPSKHVYQNVSAGDDVQSAISVDARRKVCLSVFFLNAFDELSISQSHSHLPTRTANVQVCEVFMIKKKKTKLINDFFFYKSCLLIDPGSGG